ASRGDADAARADCAQALEIGTALSLVPVVLPAAEAAAQLALSLGDPATAVDAVLPYLDLLPVVEPTMTRLVPEAVEALARLGRLDGAEARLAPFEARAVELQRPWPLAAAARGRGLLLAARGELGRAETILDEAVARAATLPLPIERARTQLVAGEIHRRAKHK